MTPRRRTELHPHTPKRSALGCLLAAQMPPVFCWSAPACPARLQEGCYAAFINRVRDNLHVVLAMSPVGDAFCARCRKFPSLINCCTIDWFTEWPADALLSVSEKFLGPVELGGEQVKAAVCRMCADIHTSVGAASERFNAQLRRRCGRQPCLAQPAPPVANFWLPLLL